MKIKTLFIPHSKIIKILLIFISIPKKQTLVSFKMSPVKGIQRNIDMNGSKLQKIVISFELEYIYGKKVNHL